MKTSEAQALQKKSGMKESDKQYQGNEESRTKKSRLELDSQVYKQRTFCQSLSEH